MTATTRAPADDGTADLTTLVDALEGAGWRIDLEQKRRASVLLVTLAAEQHGPPDVETAIRYLRPLLCTTPDELNRFAAEARRAWTDPVTSSGPSAPPTTLDDELDDTTRFQRRVRIAALAVMAALLLVGLVVVVATGDSSEGSERADEDSTLPQPQPEEDDGTLLFAVAMAGAVGIALVLVAWRFRAKRVIRRRRADGLQQGLRANFADRTALSEDRAIELSTALRRPRLTRQRDVDVPGSVEATIRAVGFPTMVYAPRLRRPEFVVLVESVSVRDALAVRFRETLAQLAALDVAVDVYEFRSSPAVCRSVRTGERVTLAALAERASEPTLVLVARSSSLVNRVTGRPARWVSRLLQWPDRFLLDTAPVAHEHPAFVSVASLEGFAGLDAPGAVPGRAPLPVDLWRDEAIWTGPTAPDRDETVAMILDLRHALGPVAFEWLAACALYPELSYWMTVGLGEALVTADDTAASAEVDVERLLVLPWFRVGYMPDWFREELLGIVAQRGLTRIRRALQTMLLVASEPEPVSPETVLAIAREDDGSLQAIWRSMKRSELALPDDPIVIDVVRGRTPQVATEVPERFVRTILDQEEALGRSDSGSARWPSQRVRRVFTVMDLVQGLLIAFAFIAAVAGSALWTAILWFYFVPVFAGVAAGVAWPARARRSQLISSASLLGAVAVMGTLAGDRDQATPPGPGVAEPLIALACLVATVVAVNIGNSRSVEPWRVFTRRGERFAAVAGAILMVALVVPALVSLPYAVELAVLPLGAAATFALLAPLYATVLRLPLFVLFGCVVWFGWIAAYIVSSASNRTVTAGAVSVVVLVVATAVGLVVWWNQWALRRAATRLPKRSWPWRKSLKWTAIGLLAIFPPALILVLFVWGIVRLSRRGWPRLRSARSPILFWRSA